MALISRSTALKVLTLLWFVHGPAHSQSLPPGADSTNLSFSSLGPGDYIVMKIWREPDLSDTVQVDNAGIAVFPKLGPLAVTGVRPDSLERWLVHEYSRYLRNPSIVVTILRRITVWGAVVSPGTYPVDLTMGITDALALAGGASSDGKSDKVELRRGNARTVINLSGSTQRIGDIPLRSGDELFVPRRSWISRNPGIIVATIGTLTSLIYLVRR